MLFKENTENSNVTFCIKNPTVKYEFQLHQDNNPLEIETLEKVTVTCHRGDYIITAVIGEHWVVNQKKIKTTYIPVINNISKGEPWANPDSKIKIVNLNKDNKSGELSLPWGPNGTKKEVQYTKEDVLIWDEDGYWYPCKKSVFENTYLISQSKTELEEQFQNLLKLTNNDDNLETQDVSSNSETRLNVNEINNLMPLSTNTTIYNSQTPKNLN
ncbi:PGDYG domain-containing protein [Spiroplasma endosymbiont of Danaus chrysippus]|uniref:PGDYG domain-containing protein n=1 Tax=Spiroplasma endosymbiont of Danaus chrysippus TaxID=2691041 RepID=UPI00157B8AAB|nr:PGDYG domain-containing protein [Spiroplasma endosymbiont of Danaus chrysippus]